MDVSDYLNTQSRKFAANLTARAMDPGPGVREAARLWVDAWDRYGPALRIVTDRLADCIPGWSPDPTFVQDPTVVRAHDDTRDSMLDFADFFVQLAASSEPTRPGELSLWQEAVLAGRVMELEHAMQRDALEERLSQERSAAMDAASKDGATSAIHRLREVENEERDKLEARQAEELRARDVAENERRLELEQALDRESQEKIDREAEEKAERERLEEAAREAEREAERQAQERAEQEERAREAREEAERAANVKAEREAAAAKEAADREAAEAKEAAERAAAEAKEQAEREAAVAKEQAEQEAREAEERRARERDLAERER